LNGIYNKIFNILIVDDVKIIRTT